MCYFYALFAGLVMIKLIVVDLGVQETSFILHLHHVKFQLVLENVYVRRRTTCVACYLQQVNQKFLSIN